MYVIFLCISIMVLSAADVAKRMPREDVTGTDNFSYKCYPQGLAADEAVILPRETVYQQVNATFSAHCYLNPLYELTSDRIYMNKLFPVPYNFTTQTVNNYTIRADITENRPSRFTVACRSQSQILCIRDVVIGYPPLNILNFRCASYNWQILSCAYDFPQNSVRQQDYILSYATTENGSYIDGCKCVDSQLKQCCLVEGQECWNWGRSAYYPYEKFSEKLFFRIWSQNALGRKSYIHIVNHFEIVIPDPAEELTTLSVGTKQVTIAFQLPVFLNLFPPGILYRVWIRSEWEENIILGTTAGKDNVTLSLEVPWPGQVYTIEVTLRSGIFSKTFENGNDTEWWSKPSAISVTTRSQPPYKTPEVIPGMFQTQSRGENRSIVVSWKTLEKYFQGGKGFRYNVIACDNEIKKVASYQTTDSFAKFENFSSSRPYKFIITPENEAGLSAHSSIVVVGRESEVSSDLYFPLVLYHEKKGVLELRWFSADDQNTTTYTVFWCKEDGDVFDTGQPCNGLINWKSVGMATTVNLTTNELLGISPISKVNQRNDFMKLSKNIRFAVSSQSSNSSISRGMKWASCPLRPYEGIISVAEDPVVEITVNEKSRASVKWFFSCNQWNSIPIKVEILWCRGKLQDEQDRSANRTDERDFDYLTAPVWPQRISIERLEPRTNYTVWIRVYYRNGEWSTSSPATFVTLEAFIGAWTIFTLAAASCTLIAFVVLFSAYSKRRFTSVWKEITRDINLPIGLRHSEKKDSCPAEVNLHRGVFKTSEGFKRLLMGCDEKDSSCLSQVNENRGRMQKLLIHEKEKVEGEDEEKQLQAKLPAEREKLIQSVTESNHEYLETVLSSCRLNSKPVMLGTYVTPVEYFTIVQPCVDWFALKENDPDRFPADDRLWEMHCIMSEVITASDNSNTNSDSKPAAVSAEDSNSNRPSAGYIKAVNPATGKPLPSQADGITGNQVIKPCPGYVTATGTPSDDNNEKSYLNLADGYVSINNQPLIENSPRLYNGLMSFNSQPLKDSYPAKNNGYIPLKDR